MKRVVIDFEFNRIMKNSCKKQPALHMEIIQFGAVMLGEDGTIQKEFSCYTRPQYSRINPQSSALTGITEKMVTRAKTLSDCLDRFLDWIGDDLTETTIYAWSGADAAQLQKECQVKGICPPGLHQLLGHWIDFQKEWDELLEEPHECGLDTALAEMDLAFAGVRHDALDDARNTAVLLNLFADPEEIRRRHEAAKARLSSWRQEAEPCCSGLADLLKRALAANE